HSLRLWLHVQLVAGISYTLALRLKQQGRDVSPILAQRGGLLHDIAKLSSIGKVHSKSHSEMGWEILNSYGQPKLAEISRRHILHAIQDPQLKPQSWEEKIVFYADKLAEGSHLVSLDERVEALKQRYGQWADNIQNSLPALYQLQTELAGALNLPEQEILPYLQKAFNGQPN
ncbi:MAG: HD domain-containing protein, partial [Anaerolineae bacterium]|nr:HD domain-containing protein [Anaerolineae bacterium]